MTKSIKTSSFMPNLIEKDSNEQEILKIINGL
jgi:hypothetical protein